MNDRDELLTRYLWNLTDAEETEAVHRLLRDDPSAGARLAELSCQETLLTEMAEGVRRRHPAGAQRKALRPRRVNWGAWISVAACLAIVAGTLVYNYYRSRRFDEVLIAHIEATAPGVKIVRDGGTIIAMLDMPLRVGDRIRTGNNGRLTLKYEGDETTIDAHKNTLLDIGGTEQGKTLHLETGAIDARVNPQPEGRPMVVTTPHARAVVKGTAFKLGVEAELARIDVFEGLVRFERLSDGEWVDVAAGQYAIAAEGVELAALALPGLPKDASAPVSPPAETDGFPAARPDLDGEILFEDDFTDWRAHWELVVGNEKTGFRPAPPELAQRVELRPQSELKPINAGDPQGMYLRLTHPRHPDGYKGERENWTLIGIRSGRPVEADRFVVEIRMAFHRGYGCYMRGIEVDEMVPITDWNRGLRISSRKYGRTLCVYRWEFMPAEDGPRKGMLLSRHFTCKFQATNPRRAIIKRPFVYSALVSPASRRIVVAFGGVLHLHRVTVRRLKEEEK